MRRALRVGAIIAALAAVLVLVDCAGDFLRIDRWLDNGGLWPDDAQGCEMAGPVPGFVSSQA